jgi:hypothetical protein
MLGESILLRIGLDICRSMIEAAQARRPILPQLKVGFVKALGCQKLKGWTDFHRFRSKRSCAHIKVMCSHKAGTGHSISFLRCDLRRRGRLDVAIGGVDASPSAGREVRGWRRLSQPSALVYRRNIHCNFRLNSRTPLTTFRRFDGSVPSRRASSARPIF